MIINIKNVQGQIRVSVPIQEGAKGVYNLMKEDYILLPFTSDTVINFSVGDYADLRGMDESLGGKLSKIYELTGKVYPTYDDNTGGYDYQLKLDAYYWKWKNKIFKYTPEGHGQEAGWSLTATLDVHLNVFIRNLNALGYTFAGTEFTYDIDATVENKAIALTYSNTNMIDALTMMAEALECEWWITENVIHFGRCEYGDAVKIELGVEAESMTRSESKGDYTTRLYVFGGEKNIPADYRPTDEQVVVNGVVQRRLMMPVDTPYLDAYTNMTEEEAIDRVVIFNDVFPQRVGTMSEVTNYESTVDNEDGTQTTTTFYRYRDTELNFSKEYILPNKTLGIHFESGLMNGLDFDVVFNPTGQDEYQWEIVANENYGRLLPDTLIKPQDGDKYVLYGYDTKFISDTLLPEAEAILKERGQQALERMMVDDSTFTANLFSDFVFADKINNTYDVGQKVNLINPAYFDNGRISRVIGWEMKLDIPWDTPKYTIGESPQYSRLGALEDELATLTFGGKSYMGGVGGNNIYVIRTNDSTPASNTNVYSALRSLAMFHRKDKTDENPFLQKFIQGADFGRFTTGMIGGSGARINVEGEGEMKSLILRDSLVVPKITFNCVDVISGDKANTFAYGTIKSVDTEQMIAELDLLSDELGTLHTNDICRGVFHNIEGGNVTDSDVIDSNGFYSYSGFSTSYFTPIEIIKNAGGSLSFRYTLQPDTNIHPIKGMNFFAYGNFVEKDRQAITYETRYYTRRLKNVNTWKIDPTKNISMQDGLLDGLVIGGFEMSGYGQFSENNYFTGTQIQFTPEQEEALKGESAYNVVLSEYNGIATLSENGEVISPYTEIVDVVSQDSNVVSQDSNVVATDYRLKTRIQAFKGKQELAYTDTYGDGKYTVEVEPHGCEYILTDGVVAITKITDTNFAYLDILVTCEGMTTFVLTYKITFVRNGENPAILDLENEMFNVIKDDDGNVVSGLPLSTKAHVYIGNTEIPIDSLSLSVPSGVTANATGSIINVTSIRATTSDTIEIEVTARYTYNSSIYEKKTKLNILKVKSGLDATMYELFITEPSVFKDDEGNYSPATIKCYLKKTTGNTTVFPTVLPADIAIKYAVDNDAELPYSLEQTIKTTAISKQIQFFLYKNNVLLDKETIFVLSDGKQGEQGTIGLSGCSIRESEWVAGREFRNDSELTGVTVRFIDVALVENDAVDTGWEAYICKKTHISSSSITYKNTDFWEQTSQNVASIFLTFLLAKNAKIKFLQSNELIITDSEGNPTTVLSGTVEGDKTRIAIGSTDIDNAPFRVNEKGTLHATDAHIEGEVTATSGSIENVIVSNISSISGRFSVDNNGYLTAYYMKSYYGTYNSITVNQGSFGNIDVDGMVAINVDISGKVTATSGSIDNVTVSSISSKNGAFSIDAEGNTTISNLTASGGTFTDITAQGGNFNNINVNGLTAVDVNVTGEINATSGTIKNVTVKNINSATDNFYIDASGNVSVKNMTAKGGVFNNITANGISANNATITGQINANTGRFGDDIYVHSGGVSTNSDAFVTDLTDNTTQFELSKTYLLYAQMNESNYINKAVIRPYYDNISNKGVLHIEARQSDKRRAIHVEYGDCYFGEGMEAPNGKIGGLSVGYVEIGSSMTIPSSASFVLITRALISVTFPSVNSGHIIYIKKTVLGGVTLIGNIRFADGTTQLTSWTFEDKFSRMFIYDGFYWNEFFCSIV